MKKKMVDGMLYADDDKTGAVMFLGASMDSEGERRSIIAGWFAPDFKALYATTPPKPGKCFSVEIEL